MVPIEAIRGETTRMRGRSAISPMRGSMAMAYCRWLQWMRKRGRPTQ